MALSTTILISATHEAIKFELSNLNASLSQLLNQLMSVLSAKKFIYKINTNNAVHLLSTISDALKPFAFPLHRSVCHSISPVPHSLWVFCFLFRERAKKQISLIKAGSVVEKFLVIADALIYSWIFRDSRLCWTTMAASTNNRKIVIVGR